MKYKYGAGCENSLRLFYSLVVPPEAKYTGREILAGKSALSPLSRDLTAVCAISEIGWTMVEQI